jgi:beta-lactamase class A
MFSAGCGNATSGTGAGTEKTVKVTAEKATTWKAPAPRRTVAPSRVPRPSGPSAQQLLTAAVGPLVSADNDDAGTAVLDLTSGQWASYDGNQEFITASIAKADILATLLYQAQQDHDGSLSAGEQSLATVMIEDSDNDAATSLWNHVGMAGGVAAANKVFGLRDTTPGPGEKWGITTTTANDQIRLLRQIFTTPSKLSASSQAYIQHLMRHVSPEQAWGVPVAADSGTQPAVKNGWLPAPKLWAVNSIGAVTHKGHHLLMAVLSHYNDSYGGGISVVEGIAAKAADAVTAYRPSQPAAGQPASSPGQSASSSGK